MTDLPVGFSKYFWDVNPLTLDCARYKTFIIERLLDYGDMDSLKWINEEYPEDDIREVVIHSRRISPKTANFFAMYYGIPKEDVLCLKPHSP